MAAENERRRHARGKRLLRFEYTHAGATVRALSSNVSAGGAFLCANDLPEAGRELQVRFVAGSDASRAVMIRALVLRAVPQPSEGEPNRGIAVRWLEASANGHPDAIKDFLDQFREDAGGQILVPDDRDPDQRFRYVFPEPKAEATAALHGRGAPIALGSSDSVLPIEMSLQDFLRDDDDADDDDDDDGPPTQRVAAPPGSLDDLFGEDESSQEAGASMREVSFDSLESGDLWPSVGPRSTGPHQAVVTATPAGRRPTAPPQPQAAPAGPPAAPAGPQGGTQGGPQTAQGRVPTGSFAAAGPPGRRSEAIASVVPTVARPAGPLPTRPPTIPGAESGSGASSAANTGRFPTGPVPPGRYSTGPQPAVPAPDPEPARPPFPSAEAPEPNDEDIGSGLVPADIPVTLEWGGQAVSARTTHLTETQVRVMCVGAPPSVYSRVAIVFPPKGRKNKPLCVLSANVTRVRSSATGDGGLLTLRLAMQNEPSDLKTYRKIFKKAGI